MQTYIAGESYAGQWIPYIADAILQSDLSTNLRGLIIGNGWISPREQYPAYLTNLVERGIVKEGSSAYTQVKASVDRCLQTIAVMDAKKAGSEGMVLIAPCEEILGAITAATKKECVRVHPHAFTRLVLTWSQQRAVSEPLQHNTISDVRPRMAGGYRVRHKLSAGQSLDFEMGLLH